MYLNIQLVWQWTNWKRIRLVETATRMKSDGLPIKLIMRYTGLTKEEIEAL